MTKIPNIICLTKRFCHIHTKQNFFKYNIHTKNPEINTEQNTLTKQDKIFIGEIKIQIEEINTQIREIKKQIQQITSDITYMYILNWCTFIIIYIKV
jgi:hypothetical protein